MSHHIVSVKVYLAIFGSLMVLTAATVAAAFLDLAGSMNTVLALTIAIIKGTLVVLYFMHVRYSSRLTWVFAIAGFFWLVVLLVFLMGDYFTRNWQFAPPGW